MAEVDSNEAKKKIKIESESQNVKIDRRPKRKKPGFHEEMFDETKYYFKKGKLSKLFSKNFKHVPFFVLPKMRAIRVSGIKILK